LKKIFGESTEGFVGSIQEVGTLGEQDEVGRIGVTSRVGGSANTSEGVMREPDLIMPKATRLHYEVEGILQDHVPPQIEEFVLSVKDPILIFLLPQHRLQIW